MQKKKQKNVKKETQTAPTREEPSASHYHALVAEQTGRQIVGGGLIELANYADLFNRLNIGVMLLDLQTFKILQVNPEIEKIFSSSRKKIEGTSIAQWMASVNDDHQAVLTYLKESCDLQNPVSNRDVAFKTSSGQGLILSLNPFRLKLADYTEVMQLLCQDVTEQRMAEKKLAELSITDEMTGLSNFRHFRQRLSEEQLRAERYESYYSVIFFDVDHFKKYNDRHGHPAGDEVLRKVAKMIKQHCRKTDLSARYGGEEFVVLCPEIDFSTAEIQAERIRQAIAAEKFYGQDTQPLKKITISVGIATYPIHGHSQDSVLKAADQAVYSSKENGRNRLTIAPVLQIPPLRKEAKKKVA